MAKKTRKFNRMEEFELDEISGVDFAAQEGARVTLMKRADETDEEFEKRLVLTTDENGAAHLLDDSEEGGMTSQAASNGEEIFHAHPWIRNNDGSITIGMADGHKHTATQKRAVPQESADSGGGQNRGEIPMTKVEEKTAVEAEAAERLEKAEARAERAEQLAQLTDVEKAHYRGLDESAQPSFLKLDADARQRELEKSQGDDPVTYTRTDGSVIRKSDGVQAERNARENDELRKDLDAERSSRRNETFEKRASDELGNLKGKQPAKVALLKAIDGLSDEDKREVSEMLASANSTLAKVFEEVGTRSGEVVVGKSEAEAKLDELARKRAESGKETFAKAYYEIIRTPEGRELYREVRANS